MRLVRMIRFSMGTIMMFVVMVAAGMALFVKIQKLTDSVTAPAALPPGWNFDVPSLFLLAIALTAVSLGSWKEHTAVQIMLQVTLACFSCLTLVQTWHNPARSRMAAWATGVGHDQTRKKRAWRAHLWAGSVRRKPVPRRAVK